MSERILNPLVSAIKSGEYRELRTRESSLFTSIRRSDIVAESLKYGRFLRSVALNERPVSFFNEAYKGMRDLEDDVVGRIIKPASFELTAEHRLEWKIIGMFDDLGIYTNLFSKWWGDNDYLCYRIWISDPWIHTAVLKSRYYHGAEEYLYDRPEPHREHFIELATPRNLDIIHEFQDLLSIAFGLAGSGNNSSVVDQMQAIFNLSVIRETIAQELLRE